MRLQAAGATSATKRWLLREPDDFEADNFVLKSPAYLPEFLEATQSVTLPGIPTFGKKGFSWQYGRLFGTLLYSYFRDLCWVRDSSLGF
eukprot:9902169-Heterocapsa_arctica.AAC.1